MVNTVEVNATYFRAKNVPRIGQRKRMMVNGCYQQLTLNKMEVIRRLSYNESLGEDIYNYFTQELWGKYHVD